MKPILAAALATLTAAPLSADVLCLRDGRILDHVKLVEHEDRVEIEFEHGTISVPREQVLECIIIDGEALAPQTDEEKEMTAKGKVRFEGKWISAKRRDQIVGAAAGGAARGDRSTQGPARVAQPPQGKRPRTSGSSRRCP